MALELIGGVGDKGETGVEREAAGREGGKVRKQRWGKGTESP